MSVLKQSKALFLKPVAWLRERMAQVNPGKFIALNIPYIGIAYVVDKEAWLYRHVSGGALFQKLMVVFTNMGLPFQNPLPSFAVFDVLAGAIAAAALKLFVLYRRKNAKKFRQGEEYGSARWGTPKDIQPFIDPVFENNIILTQTERLTMNI